MLLDVQSVIDYVAQWVVDYTKQAGKNLLVSVGSNPVMEHLSIQCTTKMSGLRIQCGCSDYIEANKYADESGLVLGDVSKTTGLYYRSYSKLGAGLADLFPFLDLEESEILQISKFLNPNLQDTLPEEFMMLEFCNSIESMYNIITSPNPPHTNYRWPYFTAIQKKWMGDVHQREKKTRHKAITKPYPTIPVHLCRRQGL